MKLFNIFSLLALISSSYSSAWAVCFERVNGDGLLPSQICVDLENIDFSYGYLEGSLKINGTYSGSFKARRELSGEDVYEVRAIIAKKEQGQACSEGSLEQAELIFYSTEYGELVGDLSLNVSRYETPDICHTTPKKIDVIKYDRVTSSNLSKINYKLVLKKFSPTTPETKIIEVKEKQPGKFISTNESFQLFLQPELNKNILVTPSGVINIGCFDYSPYSAFKIHSQCSTPSHTPGHEDTYWDYVEFIGYDEESNSISKNIEFFQIIQREGFGSPDNPPDYKLLMKLTSTTYRLKDSLLIIKGKNDNANENVRLTLSSLKPKTTRDIAVESKGTLENSDILPSDWICITEKPQYEIPGRIVRCKDKTGNFITSKVHLAR